MISLLNSHERRELIDVSFCQVNSAHAPSALLATRGDYIAYDITYIRPIAHAVSGCKFIVRLACTVPVSGFEWKPLAEFTAAV